MGCCPTSNAPDGVGKHVSIAVGDSLGVLLKFFRICWQHLVVSIAVGDSLGVLRQAAAPGAAGY